MGRGGPSCGRPSLEGVSQAKLVLEGKEQGTMSSGDVPMGGAASPVCRRRHDLRLPDWGPYSRHYAGVVHIPDVERGATAEFAVCVGRFRGRLAIPNQRYDSDWSPTAAAPDLSWYQFEVEVDADLRACVAVCGTETDRRLIRVRLSNRGRCEGLAVVHLLAACRCPTRAGAAHALRDDVLKPAALASPYDVLWIDACTPTKRVGGAPQPRDVLPYDGWRPGEVRADGLIGGCGMGLARGDCLTYTLPAGRRWARIRAPAGLSLGISAGTAPLAVDAGKDRWVDVGTGTGPVDVAVLGAGAGSVLNGWVVAPERPPEPVEWTPSWVPERENVGNQAVLLGWRDLAGVYGVLWHPSAHTARGYRSERLDACMRTKVHDHVPNEVAGEGEGYWFGPALQPIPVPARGEADCWAWIVHGDSPEHARNLLTHMPIDVAAWGAREQALATGAWDHVPSRGGMRHRDAQRRFAATVLQNVVYPVYTRGRYIRHHTPGKAWDSLYTWDSGFTGLALLEYDPRRAADCLAAYLTPDAADCPFIHHGTPLPVQVHLAQEIWNRTRDRHLLAWAWPGLLRMHRYLAGRLPGSRTGRFSSGLLQTWDIFYNSGGWDDYPPQKEAHARRVASRMACAVTSAHVAWSARILRGLAGMVGDAAAIPELQSDVLRLTEALQCHAWNEEEGVFSYVEHDENGKPVGRWRHPSGVDWNLGFDGVTPMLAGLCTRSQTRRLLDRLFDPAHHWTAGGLDTVDRAAPYHEDGGYWNGSVWLPHQWFLWRACLDLGRGDLAWRIAERALNVWTREIRARGRCFEHVHAASGHGGGWHHFGGLSAPYAAWYGTYYLAGRISGGSRLLVEQARESDGDIQALLSISEGETPATVIVTLPAGSAAEAELVGPGRIARRRADWLELTLPAGRHEIAVRYSKGRTP